MGAGFLVQRAIPFKGPLGTATATEWLRGSYQDIRTGFWSGWGALPDSLASQQSVVADLNSAGVLQMQGCWAPTNRGTILWAVYAPGSSILKHDSMVIFECSSASGQSRSSGTSTGSSSPGLPPGAPPANQGGPLGRLRYLKARKGIR